MATLFSSLNSGQNPTMLYTVTYTQTARDASSVTYSVKVSAILANPSTGYFNAKVYPKIKIGGTTVSFDELGNFPKGTTTAKTSTKTVKATGINAGTSSLSYTFSATTQLGGTSSASTGYVAGKTGTIPVSIYATTPSLSGSITIKDPGDSGITLTSYVRETLSTGKLNLSWPKATNANGTLTYQLRVSVNGGDYTDVSTAVTTNSYSNHGPGSVNTFRYAVRAKNTIGSTTLYSAYIYSNTITKNAFSTKPTATSSASVSYATGSFTFTVGAAKDKMGTAMTYTIAGISPTAISGTTTIGTGSRTIYTNPASATGTYMTLTQLKNGAGNTSTYKGTLKFRITAKNKYGSTSYVDLSVPIDLGKDAPITNAVPALSIHSDSYYSVTIGSTTNKYIFPAYKAVKLSIAGGVVDALGRNCSFDVLMIESGTTKTIKNTGVQTAAFTTTVSGSEAGMGSAKKNVQFQIRAKTPNGKTKDGTALAAVDLHYYNKPTITASNIVRESSKATFKITIKQSTSVSVTNVHTLPANYTQSTPSGTTTQTYTLTRTGMTEALSEKVTVKVHDAVGNALKTDGSLVASVQVSIPSFQPMLSVRKKGVGINTVNTYSESAVLKVDGKTQLSGALAVTGATTMSSTLAVTGATTISGATTINNTATARKINVTPTAIATASTALLEINTSHDGNNSGSNGKTFIGYNSGGKYYHYFRGSGKTTIDTLEGMQIVSGDLDMRGNKITNTLQYNIVNSSSGKSGRVYAGTGGIAMTADSGTNLHLGVASANDFNIDADNIWVNKPLLLKAGQGIYTTGNTAEATQLYSNIWRAVPGSTNYTNMYVQAAATGELRIQANTSTSSAPVYRPIRTSTVYIEGSSVGYLGNNLNLPGNSVVFNTSNSVVSAQKGYLVLRSVANDIIYSQGSQLRSVAPSTTTTYRPMLASAFTVNSTSTAKTKIRAVDNDDKIDTMQLLKDTNIYTYHLEDELENGYYYNKKIGFIAEATPRELKMEGEQAIDLYSMTSTLWDVCKKQQETIESQQEQIEELWEMINVLCDNEETEEAIAG